MMKLTGRKLSLSLSLSLSQMFPPSFPQQNKTDMLDVSELLRPEPSFTTKPVGQYRDFSIDYNDPIKERVRKLYVEMHTNQTFDFVKSE